MRAIVIKNSMGGQQVEYLAASAKKDAPNCNSGEQGGNESVFVTLDIQVATLRRLVKESKLSAVDLHCLDGQAKSIVRQAILDGMASC